MILIIKELCAVDYINDDDEEVEDAEYLAVRTIIYGSEEDKFLDALKDYEVFFDSDKIISSEDEFEGTCLYTVDIISVEVHSDSRIV